jgi:hypothetical protein
VAIALERAPVLRGTLGRGGPGACEGAEVQVYGPDETPDPEDTRFDIDADSCRFELEDLPEEGPLTIVARRAGRIERALVTLPDAGDPAFLCLAGPCDPPSASLAVYVADASGLQVEMAGLEVTREAPDGGEMTVTTIGGFGLLHGQRAGAPVHLSATALDRTAEATIFPGAGVTDVVLTLPAGEAPEAPTEEGEIVHLLMR